MKTLKRVGKKQVDPKNSEEFNHVPDQTNLINNQNENIVINKDSQIDQNSNQIILNNQENNQIILPNNQENLQSNIQQNINPENNHMIGENVPINLQNENPNQEDQLKINDQSKQPQKVENKIQNEFKHIFKTEDSFSKNRFRKNLLHFTFISIIIDILSLQVLW